METISLNVSSVLSTKARANAREPAIAFSAVDAVAVMSMNGLVATGAASMSTSSGMFPAPFRVSCWDFAFRIST